MTLEDAGRAVLVAYDRVTVELERGSKREGSPEELAIAMVALQSAITVLRNEVSARAPRPRRPSARVRTIGGLTVPCPECHEAAFYQHRVGCSLARSGDAIVRGDTAWHK